MVTWVLDSADPFTGVASGASIHGRILPTGARIWDVVLRDVLGNGSNQVRGNIGFRNSVARLDGAAGDHQRVDLDVVGRDQCGPMVRVGASGEGYCLVAASQFGAWTIGRLIAAGSGFPFDGVTILTTGTNRTGSETSVSLRVHGPTTLEAWISGVLVGTTTDATHATGRPGIAPWSNNIALDGFDYYSDSDEGGGGGGPTPGSSPSGSMARRNRGRMR